MVGNFWISRFTPFLLKTAKSATIASLIFIAVFATGCGFTYDGPPTGAILGRADVYDYSPTVIQTGNVQQFWWCGGGKNPEKTSQYTDTILYASMDLLKRSKSGPKTVLGESPGKWDSAYICNPKVVGGTFNNPLADGETYSYAMYYVGTSYVSGVGNCIGVAFSNDGIKWKKYPQPVITSSTVDYYGVGQPSVYNSDHKAGIWLFYEDLNDPTTTHHIESRSTDGIHFTVVGTLSKNGLDTKSPQATWGDIAYDSATGYWYAAFNLQLRPVLENITERGQLGVALYQIPNDSLISGSHPWQLLKSFDTNATGNESTFLAGFLRDQYGTVNIGPYPTIQLYTSISNPRSEWDESPRGSSKSGDTRYWDIGTAEWVPGHPLIPLNSYVNSAVHEVTTGWIDPGGDFNLESTLGHLYEGPQQGATVSWYGCKGGAKDYFVSTDIACEGQRLLGTNGFGYSEPVAGLNLFPVYSCASDHDHFVSKDIGCDGQQPGKLLGYILP